MLMCGEVAIVTIEGVAGVSVSEELLLPHRAPVRSDRLRVRQAKEWQSVGRPRLLTPNIFQVTILPFKNLEARNVWGRLLWAKCRASMAVTVAHDRYPVEPKR